MTICGLVRPAIRNRKGVSRQSIGREQQLVHYALAPNRIRRNLEEIAQNVFSQVVETSSMHRIRCKASSAVCTIVSRKQFVLIKEFGVRIPW